MFRTLDLMDIPLTYSNSSKQHQGVNRNGLFLTCKGMDKSL